VQVIAAPAGPQGGVIYVFEDITEQLVLQSQHRSLLDVQRSTINALSEAVAVFGTNGRLTLANPRLSALWKLPVNVLEQSPHIDQIAAVVAAELPEDGAAIWARPQAQDHRPQSRPRRPAGPHHPRRRQADRLCRDPPARRAAHDDLPRCHRERQLPARADRAQRRAVTADRLKDAFVQNVSYEFARR
jgi:PAS domain-containing protein